MRVEALVAALLAVNPGRGMEAQGAPPPARPDVAQAAHPRGTVQTVVVDQAGHPLAHVLVVAADSTKVIGIAHSDEAGLAELPSPHPRYNFGILSPTLRLSGVTPRGRGRYELVAAPLPPADEGEGVNRAVATIDAAQASVFRGRVVDETGGGLPGVRIEATRAGGAVVSTVFSVAGGGFALVVPGGQFALRASAPGLTAASSSHEQGVLVLVMAIAGDTQTVRVTSGHTLSFRPSDSIDPEYTPPAPVRAYLMYAYGICPSYAPLKAYERRNLKKYWYLDVLREEPPNPATISTVGCRPPSALDHLPRGQSNVQGFEIWEEAVGAPFR